jgi:SAM-dependent methyltransferase
MDATGSYDPRTFTEAHVFEAGGLLGWLTRRRKAAVLAFLRRELRRSEAPRILDIGCGYGDMLAETAGALRVGIDVNAGALAQAAARVPGAHFLMADVARLPLADGSFDGVICSEVLEHLEHPETLASEIVRVTRPGGTYCITVPNEAVTTLGRYVLGKRPAKSPAHKQDFTPATVASLFPDRPMRQRVVPFGPLPFALSTNVVLLFQRPPAN